MGLVQHKHPTLHKSLHSLPHEGRFSSTRSCADGINGRVVCCACCCFRLFPAFQNIRAISKILTAHVGQHMVEAGLGSTPDGCTNWEEYVAANMWTADQL